jgi:outer membrane protein assembly factor BamB
MLRRVVLAISLALLLVSVVRAAAPRFWRLEGTAAFLKGEIENLSLDSEARLRLGPAVRTLFDPETPNAWCVVRDDSGVLYVGTGNDGRLFRVEGEDGTVLFDAEELEVHAVAVGPDGRVYAGTSPDGEVYAIDAEGAARPFFDPPEKYIWALALDGAGNLVVATGGEGRVYRVRPDGTSESLLTSTDTHVLSLALDDDGRIFAGSSPEGVVYRIDRQGGVFVLLDSAYREIKALDVGDGGAVYAGAINGGSVPSPEPPPPAAPPTPSSAPVAQVTVTETFAPISPAGAAPVGVAAAPVAPSAAAPKGALLRIDADGTVETLWSSADDVPHAVASVEQGVLVGTGDKGKLYRVRPDGTWALIASLPAQQVTGIAVQDGHAAALVTSNPARVATLSRRTATEGHLLSEVKDAEAVAAWGRVRWEGNAPAGTAVRLETRSGNTSSPDTTWGEWTAVGTGVPAAAIRSESARFLQLRLTLVGRDDATPVLEALSAAYLQRNLRPRVTSITVHPPGQVFQKPISVTGEPEVLGLEPDPLQERGVDHGSAGAASITAFSRKLQRMGLRTFVWEASDPNRDLLVYDVQYRALGDPRWRPLRSGLTEAVLAWDTTSMADGRYLVRVTASDAPDNPPALALAGHKDSTSFEVDNAPPVLTASLASGGTRIRATARDAGSRIRRMEFSVDAGRWQEVYPLDGINDSSEENYEFAVTAIEGARPHVVVLRVTDRLGNVATGRVDVP